LRELLQARLVERAARLEIVRRQPIDISFDGRRSRRRGWSVGNQRAEAFAEGLDVSP
jgi:hypothetical protein